MNELNELKGKTAIVTGGSRGLGYGVAEAFVEHGMNVVIAASSSRVFEAEEKLQKLGCCKAYRIDLQNAEERELFFKKSLAYLGGRLDVLANIAGIQYRSPSEEFPLDQWQKVLDINLTAVFHLCQLAGRVMLPQKSGKIINIASMLSFFGGLTVPAYAASKGGIAQLTKALSNEWAQYGINVNALAPGYMATEMNTALSSPDSPRYESITARIPAKRWGTEKDMKGPALFLASDLSNYLNGAVIPVDGGYLGC